MTDIQHLHENRSLITFEIQLRFTLTENELHTHHTATVRALVGPLRVCRLQAPPASRLQLLAQAEEAETTPHKSPQLPPHTPSLSPQEDSRQRAWVREATYLVLLAINLVLQRFVIDGLCDSYYNFVDV